MRIVLSDKARADLLRIFQYLDERSPAAANDFIRRIDENFKNLSRFPFIGRERSHLASGLRCLIVGLHLIFYTGAYFAEWNAMCSRFIYCRMSFRKTGFHFSGHALTMATTSLSSG
jgi:toxin ParE1/3/4